MEAAAVVVAVGHVDVADGEPHELGKGGGWWRGEEARASTQSFTPPRPPPTLCSSSSSSSPYSPPFVSSFPKQYALRSL